MKALIPFICASLPELSLCPSVVNRILRCSGKIPAPKYTPFAAAATKSLQSCLTLCDPIDGSPPGSPVPGILQARTLEQVAISLSNA